MPAPSEADPTIALAHAVALAESAAEALASVPMGAVDGFGLGELLIRLGRAQRTLEASAAALGARFASSSAWELDGASSAVRWLYGRGNDAWSQSRALFDRGEAVRDFPQVALAWRQGALSAQHVDALARLTRQFSGLRSELVAVDGPIATVASQCEPKEFYQRLRQLCHRVDPEAVEAGERDRGIGLHVSTLLDGYVRVDGTLDPVLGASFVAALESGRRDCPDGLGTGQGTGLGTAPLLGSDDRPTHRSLSERNLDALRRVLQAAGAATGDLALPAVSGERPTVNVSVPIDALADPASTEVGWLERFGIPTTMITGAQARQLACDASIRPFIMDSAGQLIAMLPKARSIHPALRRAVFLRDRHCRFPGCASRIDEVHHIEFHSRGGPTVMSNLLGLCSHHHHRIHESGWRLSGNPAGRVTFRSGAGRKFRSHPPDQLSVSAVA